MSQNKEAEITFCKEDDFFSCWGQVNWRSFILLPLLPAITLTVILYLNAGMPWWASIIVLAFLYLSWRWLNNWILLIIFWFESALLTYIIFCGVSLLKLLSWLKLYSDI